MPAYRDTRRSRRLSRRSPMNAGDYSWHDSAHVQSLPAGCGTLAVEALPPVPFPPSPSTHTTPSYGSPSPTPSPRPTSDLEPEALLTHLPFAPGSSHTRNRKNGHIPRPPNAFMVFRSWLWNKDDLKSVERDNRNVSRIAGRCWNELADREREPFRRLAEEAKARHARMYPEYKYTPSFRRPRASPGGQQRRAPNPRRAGEDETAAAATARCKKVADLLIDGVKRDELALYFEDDARDGCDEAGPALALAPTEFPAPNALVDLGPPAAPPRRKSVTKNPARAPRKKRASRTAKNKIVVAPPVRPQRNTRSPTPPPAAPFRSRLDAPDAEAMPMPMPELVYPADGVQEFVATEDIPTVWLGNGFDETSEKCSDFYSLPSHMEPAANTDLAGIKPEAVQFVDDYMLNAFSSYSPAPMSPVFHPLQWSPLPWSPVTFTNPFENTDGSEEPFFPLTLDQLFSQPGQSTSSTSGEFLPLES